MGPGMERTHSQSRSDVSSNLNALSSSASSAASVNNKPIIDITRKLYDTQFEMFVINNLAMSVVFFEDYDDDLQILNDDSPRQLEITELSHQMQKEYKKTLVFPDTFYENVNRNIAIKRRSDKDSIPLLPERVVVVDETVMVKETQPQTNNDENNNSADDDMEHVLLERVKENGYIRLRNIYPRITFSTESSSRSARSSFSNGELDIACMKYPLVHVDEAMQSRKQKKHWYQKVRPKKTRPSFEENNADVIQTRRHDEYLSSVRYAKDFRNKFPTTVGPYLGFDEEELTPDRFTNSTFYCESRRTGSYINYEVTFAVEMTWPEVDTLSWLVGERNKSVAWPPVAIRNQIRNENCMVLPRHTLDHIPDQIPNGKGSTSPRHTLDNEETEETRRQLEWEIAFPRADRYLQTAMTHAQTKTYFYLVLLHRSFIEPLTQHKGFLLSHLKMVFYWELERDALNFSETRMGLKLFDLVNKIYNVLGNKHLSHYFLRPDTNACLSIDEKYRKIAHDKMNDIKKKQVAHFIAALCNIRYTSRYTSKIGFPEFKFKQLHELLTEEQPILIPVRSYPLRKGAIIKNKIKKKDNNNQANNNKANNQSKPEEWIDLKISCKVGNEETIRKIGTIKMFIEHFIAIGDVCFLKGRENLGRSYFLQANDLTKILEEQGDHDVTSYTDAIYKCCPDYKVVG